MDRETEIGRLFGCLDHRFGELDCAFPTIHPVGAHNSVFRTRFDRRLAYQFDFSRRIRGKGVNRNNHRNAKSQSVLDVMLQVAQAGAQQIQVLICVGRVERSPATTFGPPRASSARAQWPPAPRHLGLSPKCGT